jgi:creatinine amidohydrolase/Fe(II)-dependent formamide hydrolase-like protein
MSTTDPLAPVRVFQRLEVGPPRVERNRIVVRYAVTRDGETDATEQVIRYGEPVFAPAQAVSSNLAALAGVQVALNYGLFCEEIVLYGPYDRADRALLRDALHNTAREILVKKLLEPNPFLVGAAREIRVERFESAWVARLVFPDPVPELPGDRAWSEDPSRVAVLSSGGKDSLLSFGLLEEMGQDVHALFVNESGRHWYTALNGFRHLEATRPHTARVWNNCDRIYGWMLRQMPFVRQDYARVRSDEYPVRLWTVAVFLFSVLPLLHRRGIGRLVIGDEHDTSRKVHHEGIEHYDGLYDQSRWFDLALSRYFHRKGWRLAQFSLLRPMSELLIQKTLVERYPALFAQQVSCHAAHVEGDRVLPCGRCEKCRRIVGLVLALGGEPGACGYGPAQVTSCLAALSQEGVHQEADGAHHLAHLLLQKGLIEADTPIARSAREVPEVEQLRFDATISPISDVPPDLRDPLFRILADHARSAVRRRGRSWVPYNPLSPKALAKPWPFASPRGAALDDNQSSWRLAHLTWPQAQRRFSEVDVALLPVGAIEQHGPHLPLDCDAWDAERLAHDVARGCTEPRPLVLPLVPYGVSYHHDDFPGTLSVNPHTLSRFVVDLGMSAARHGVRKLVIVNGHGGNIPALQFAAQIINRDAHIFTCVDTGETSDAEVARLLETPHDVHAGEYETSTTLANRPERVFMDRAEAHVPRFSSRYLDFGSTVSVAWFGRTSRISPSGVMGDPTCGTAEKGRRMWEIAVRNLVELVEYLRETPLDQILRRRE